MSEFICGLLFFLVGAAMMIHNRALAERSLEFELHSPRERKNLLSGNRVLCLIAGLIVSGTGMLTMLSAR